MVSSPLGSKRKMSVLSPGHMREVVSEMNIGGFGMQQVRPTQVTVQKCACHVSHRAKKVHMMQARFLFVHTLATGTRAPHFAHLRWKHVRLHKVPMLRGRVVEGDDGVHENPDVVVRYVYVMCLSWLVIRI